ncbi:MULTISPECIES: hypothetical protein [Peribacillus]
MLVAAITAYYLNIPIVHFHGVKLADRRMIQYIMQLQN